MGIGAGVFLIAIGAILAFAVDYTANGVDIATVGWILIAAGALGIVLDLIVFAPRRRGGTSTGIVEERRVYDEGTPRV